MLHSTVIPAWPFNCVLTEPEKERPSEGESGEKGGTREREQKMKERPLRGAERGKRRSRECKQRGGEQTDQRKLWENSFFSSWILSMREYIPLFIGNCADSAAAFSWHASACFLGLKAPQREFSPPTPLSSPRHPPSPSPPSQSQSVSI